MAIAKHIENWVGVFVHFSYTHNIPLSLFVFTTAFAMVFVVLPSYFSFNTNLLIEVKQNTKFYYEFVVVVAGATSAAAVTAIVAVVHADASAVQIFCWVSILRVRIFIVCGDMSDNFVIHLSDGF